MKLAKKQNIDGIYLRLQKLGYEPCNRQLNLYPEDFKGNIWNEVLQCLNIGDCYGVTLAVVGVKEELENE